jgi:hypothetical protein
MDDDVTFVREHGAGRWLVTKTGAIWMGCDIEE